MLGALFQKARRLAANPMGVIRRTIAPPPVEWLHLRRTEPLSRIFGLDRGNPVDRYYIEQFLAAYRLDVKGDVLEVAETTYTRKFASDPAELRPHALFVKPHVPADDRAIVGDLATGEGIPTSAFDCIILTQTLPFIFDVFGAMRSCHAALKPGGTLLATVSGISQISRYDMDRWGDYWRFTTLSARKLAETSFGPANVQVVAYGNVLAAVALLHGMAQQDLTEAELDLRDEDYQVIIGIRATRNR